ncbi:glycosyl hydrolases family 31-domain-containing protein [Blyttiomyces helicus]|uniref:Glucosidase II subunit alpha n=1 Tax=Blyttiomyces helicus TaxID=388810 RepID=A0A4P9WF46_9FUNG|nr:glycosyl hydrolases family 31-domain-containing protein [Blyttiomyces helicus]|eukprot:RKO90353.1 glycosyl hydrolases family 31-domain-containing protein [Blyttiomyces helicus]
MVKHADFKRCDQSGFCRRQRAYADLADKLPNFRSPYLVSTRSVSVDESAGIVTAQILNLAENKAFNLEVSLLDHNSARVRIREAEPLKPRYEAPLSDLVIASSGLAPDAAPEAAEAVSVSWGPNTFTIHADPFAFELAVDGIPAITFNGRNYFNFEHTRAKAAEPAVVEHDAAPEAAARLRDELKKDLWEESFNGKSDSKPNGPTSIGIDLSFPGSANVYGLPQHASSFSLKSTRGADKSYGEPFRLYNFDVFEYELDSPMALYGSIPFMMAHKKGLSSGVFWLNSAEMWVDVEKSKGDEKVPDFSPRPSFRFQKPISTETHWSAESGILDLFVFLGPTPADVFDAYTALTGRPTLPQSFAVAYHQCRWNYLDETDVAEVDAGFDKYDIPYDVLWLDIEHTDAKKYFTWDKVKFPHPEKMQKSLDGKGRKMVTIIDPHIKRDDNYHVSKEAKEEGIFVKDKDGKDFEGWCWPGDSNWIDYTMPEGRRFWAEKFLYTEYQGSTPSLYTWNDMNEPSVFSGPEITMPKDNIHYGGYEHRDVHNIYGRLQHRSTYEGHLLRSADQDRPFILSRAFFAGTQRYGAIWTGDNFARWDHLEASVPMLLSIGISGVTFAGGRGR